MPPGFLYEWSEAGMFLFVAGTTGIIAAIIHFLMEAKGFSFLCQIDVSPVLQTLCGTLFVLSVTFLANSVWQTESRARELVNQEARSLRTIEVYLDAMSGSASSNLLSQLKDYAQEVAEEWPHMAHQGGLSDADQRLDEVYRTVGAGLSNNEGNVILLQRILTALDTLSQARQSRIRMAKEQVSGVQWFSVSFMALLVLIAIGVCHAHARKARGIALSVMTLAIAVSLFVIIAHDRPFVGRLAITPEPILTAVQINK